MCVLFQTDLESRLAEASLHFSVAAGAGGLSNHVLSR